MAVLELRLLVVVFSLAPGAAAVAAEPGSENPEAKAHLDRALSLYQSSDYLQAAREFEQAYQLDAQPELLFAWAQALRMGGDCDQALPLYRRFLQSEPAAEGAQRARKQIERCEEVVLARPRPETHVEPAAVELPGRWYTHPLGGGLAAAALVAAGVGVTFAVFASNSLAAAGRAPTYGELEGGASRASLQRAIALAASVAAVGLLGGAVLTWVLREVARSANVPATAVTVLF